MAHVAFDTLKFVERLIAAGVPNNQAKAIAEAQNDAFNEALDNTLATKADLVRTETNLNANINNVKADVLVLKWMMGFLLAGVATLIVKALF